MEHGMRYAGHLPQLRYRCGKTFSSDCLNILTDPEIQKSMHSVLSHTENCVRSPEDVLQEQRRLIMAGRVASWGDQKFTDPMIPGYTGEIPKMNSYEGKTYSATAFNAITDFENSQRNYRKKVHELKALNAFQSGKQSAKETLVSLPPLVTTNQIPLRKVRHDMKEYHSPANFKPAANVYKLSNEDRDKRFTAGYMGFVPRTLEQFGKDYEHTTHRGLNTFTDDLKKRQVVLSTPVSVEHRGKQWLDDATVYPATAGLIPKYTGHAPGGRYQFGKTYWESSYNSKDKFSPEKMPWSLQQKATLLK